MVYTWTLLPLLLATQFSVAVANQYEVSRLMLHGGWSLISPVVVASSWSASVIFLGTTTVNVSSGTDSPGLTQTKGRKMAVVVVVVVFLLFCAYYSC